LFVKAIEKQQKHTKERKQWHSYTRKIEFVLLNSEETIVILICVLLMIALLLLWVHSHTHNAIGEQACVLFLDFLFFIGSNCLKK
jgi:hypothetical protein